MHESANPVSAARATVRSLTRETSSGGGTPSVRLSYAGTGPAGETTPPARAAPRPRGGAGPRARRGGLGDRLAPLRGLRRRGDDDLLRGPDDEPHIVPHDASEHSAEEDLPAVRGREKLTDAAVLAHPVEDDEPARDEGQHRAPAEPPERAADEAADDHARPDGPLGRREERRLDERAGVEQPDPGDDGEEMKPAHREQPDRSA